MGLQDTTRLLQRMGQAYPECVQIGQLLEHSGLGCVRAVRALRGLFEGGLITAHGPACVEGIPGSELRLTEPGMVVAFGLACVEGDPRAAITALEAQTLVQLHRCRESR
jgi:hypothetical protein